jgi:hypothetical protein
LRALWFSLLVVTLLGVGAAPASAQGIGVRAGVSGDPDQFYAGLHYETKELIDRLRFRPNIELGVGDDVTLVALNFEFAYKFPINRSVWSVYLGGGPALNIYEANDETELQGGFNILLGLAHRRGLFTELKVGLGDSPGIKFGVGYSFRP